MKMVKFASEVNPDNLLFGTDFPFNNCFDQETPLKKMYEMDIPDNINRFIQNNMTTLTNIYDAGEAQYTEGFLMVKCNINENKVDAFFVSAEKLKNINQTEFWNSIKEEKDKDITKKIFYVNDIKNEKYTNIIFKK